jgi:hypothetical protein
MELALPLDPEGNYLLQPTTGLGSWVVLVEPGADLVAELLLLGGEREIHGAGAYIALAG